MRSELEPLIGKPVMASGYLSSYKHVNNEVWMCLSKPEIRVVDPHQNGNQIYRQRACTTDHLWTIGTMSEAVGMPNDPLYKKVAAFGYIKPYWRKDGSSDLGLSWVAGPMDLKEMIHEALQAKEYETVIRYVDETFADGVSEFCFDKKHSPRQVQSILRSFKLEAERAIKTARDRQTQAFIQLANNC